MISTFQVRRRARIGTSYREGGEPAPDAHLWRLSEGLVRSGTLIEVEMSEADFAAAVTKYCPDDAAAIYAKLGLTPLDNLAKTRGRPKGKTVLASKPVLVAFDENE